MTLPTYQPDVTAAFASDIAKATVQAHRGEKSRRCNRLDARAPTD